MEQCRIFLTLGHWAHQSTELFYNGVSKEDIEGENRNLRNGIHGTVLREGTDETEWSKQAASLVEAFSSIM